MKYLVTGGAGFVGSNIAFSLLNERKEKVVVLDDFSSGNFKNLLGFGGDIIADSILSPLWWEKIGKVDAVFHEAAITDTTVTDQKKMMEVNVEGFKNVLNFALKYDIRTLVYASSAATYGRGDCPMREEQPATPENVYGFSKAIMDNVAGEFCARNPKFKVVGLRYFNVYGPGEYYKGKFASMIYQLYLQMKAGRNPRVFKYGEQSRDFVYIKDVVRINLNALDAESSCVCNAGTGKAESFNYVIDCLNKAMKTDLSPEYFDNPYDFFQNRTQADLRRAKANLDYRPEWSLEDGVTDYVKTMEKK
ncbi:MAG: ADP-glyceromanno-heptose 6-epimerase [Elusimicrobia bacterium CG08_land_8_20_14_0_20_51_18]|nr:MAG: ADP-glyceromanno-heptose 6-epimerase [Elusimicrobia bacterium CG08_land_8_20_14_0_20_51_18]